VSLFLASVGLFTAEELSFASETTGFVRTSTGSVTGEFWLPWLTHIAINPAITITAMHINVVAEIPKPNKPLLVFVCGAVIVVERLMFDP
jgi:hypothetical protein